MIHIDSSAATASLRATSADIMATIRQALGQSVAFALSLARNSTAFKDRTGALRRSIVRGQKSAFGLFVRAGAKHALWVEEPTKPHTITARRAKALRFVHAGQLRFAKSVQHPGTKGAFFMRDARDQAEVVAFQFVQAGIDRAVSR